MRKTFTKQSLLCIFTSVCLSLQGFSYTSFAQGVASWKQENGTWKYYDGADTLIKSWVKIGDVWYYLDPITGVMKTGWFMDTNGKWYFLSTAEDASQGQMLKSWQVIDEYDYFFYEDGSLAVDTVTPDGFKVNSEGRVVGQDGKVEKAKKAGYKSVKPAADSNKKTVAKTSGTVSKGSSGGFGGGSGGGSGSTSRSSGTSNNSVASNNNSTEDNSKAAQTNDGTLKTTPSDDGKNNQTEEDKQQNNTGNNISPENKLEETKPTESKSGTDNARPTENKGRVEDTKSTENKPATDDKKDNNVADNENKQDSTKPAEDKPKDSKDGTKAKQPDATSSASIERWRQKYIAEGKDPDAYKKPKKEDKAEDKKEGKTEDKVEDTKKASPSNAESLLVKSQTRMINSEIGWARYVSIVFASGNWQDYTIEVDGTDISTAVSPVDDEGTIVKWRSTVSSPKVLKVTRNADSAVQEVVLNQTKAGEIVTAPQAGSASDMPDYLIANGRIPRFDYYLDNYDSEGNVRDRLTHTTFDLKGERERKSIVKAPIRYWTPETKIDAMGRGELIVKFALENEEHEKWFDQITNIKVLNPEYNILNRNMMFETYKESGFGNTGVIKIALPQSNIVNRGRYYLNIASSYVRETRTVPIHLVDATNFKMILSSSTSSPVTGGDIKFTIKGENGESFGNDIRIVAKRLVLTKPSGAVVELERIKDWYVIGDLLTISGSSGEGADKKINTDEEGIYTISLYADGYQLISKKVEVLKNNIEAQASTVSGTANTAAKVKTKRIDVVSSATGGGKSGGSASFDSEAGIGGYVNGNCQFNHDLLINALILNELGRNNESSKAVVKRWFDVSRVDYVMNSDATTLYKFENYLDAVKEVRINEQRELSFEGFKEIGASSITQERPRDIKLVLEDGLLGTTTAFRNQVGKVQPAIMGTVANKGEVFTLTTDDPEYFAAITNLTMDGNSAVLRSDSYLKQYEFNADKTELKIYPKAFNSYNPPLVGNHVLKIEATGYKVNVITLRVNESNPDVRLALAEKSDNTAYKVGEEVKVQVVGEEAAARNYLSNITSINMRKPDGSSRLVYTESVGGSSMNDYYEIQDTKLVFMPGLFSETGEYTIHVLARGYVNKLIKVNVETAGETPKEQENPQETLKKAPVLKNTEYSKTANMPYNRYYKLVFDTDTMSLEEVYKFINSDEAMVEVNGVKYSKKENFNRSSVVNSYASYNDGSIWLSADGFNKEENTVKITVPGYEVFSGQVDKAVTPPSITFKAADYAGSDRLKLEFDTNTVYMQDYLENIKRGKLAFKISVNGNAFTKVSYRSERISKGKYKFTEDSAYGTLTGIELSLEDVDMTKPVNITLELDGYKAVNTSYISAKKLKAVPSVKSFEYSRIEKVPFNRYYELVFDKGKMSVADIYEFINSDAAVVEVNGVKYSKRENFNGRDLSKVYVAYDDATMWLSPDGFNKDVNTVKITADGYETLEYTITKEVKSPAMTFKKSDYFGTDRVLLNFDTGTLFMKDYLENIKMNKTPFKIRVNGVEFSRVRFSFDKISRGSYKVIENSAYGTATGLELSLDGVDLSKPVNISIELEGYKSVDLSYTK